MSRNDFWKRNVAYIWFEYTELSTG